MGARYIGVGKEAIYGTSVALTEYLDAIDEGIKDDNSIVADQTMGVRGLTKPTPGQFKVGGPFKAYAEPENLGLLLLGLFGAGSDTPSTPEAGVTLHTFIPTVTPQYLTIGIGSDVTAGQKTLGSAAVRKAKFSIGPGQKLLAEFDVFAQTHKVDALVAPTFSTKQPFHWVHASAKIATVAKTYVKAMTIEVENKWEEADYTVGSRLLRNAPLGGMVVKGTMDVMFDQLDQLKMFLGGAAVTAPAATLTKQRLDLEFISDVLAGATQFYFMKFIMLETLFKTHKANINKRDRTIENLEWECYWPTAGAQFSILYQNTIAAY